MFRSFELCEVDTVAGIAPFPLLKLYKKCYRHIIHLRTC